MVIGAKGSKFHRFSSPEDGEASSVFTIFGKKGKIMKNRANVYMDFAVLDINSDVILISGVQTNVEAAKVGLAVKVTELIAESEVKKKDEHFKMRMLLSGDVESNPGPRRFVHNLLY
jgi:hypothetical protein